MQSSKDILFTCSKLNLHNCQLKDIIMKGVFTQKVNATATALYISKKNIFQQLCYSVILLCQDAFSINFVQVCSIYNIKGAHQK